MKNFILFFLFTQMAAIGWAQNQVQGKVTTPQKEPVPFANVLLLHPTTQGLIKGVVTDDKGVFIIQQVKPGAYTLKISMIGYQTFVIPKIDISSAKPLPPFQVTLAEHKETLEAVTVTAQKPLLEQRIDRTVVNVQSSIIAKGSDILTILERSPGIEVDRINGQIQMQGKAGVLVMLDGKIMRMEMAGLIQLLQGMNSDNVVSIELITAPPASFDAEGNAGIINIITKKQQTEGLHLIANANTAYGLRPKYGGSVNLNMRQNRFNFFADLSANYSLVRQDVTIDRQNIYNGVVTNTHILALRPAETGLYNYRAGIDYDFSPRTTVGVLFAGYLRTWAMDTDIRAQVDDNTGQSFSPAIDAFERNDWQHWMFNFNFRHQFSDKSRLSFDVDYLHFFEQNPTDYAEVITDPNGIVLNTREFISRKITPIEFKVAKLDYTHSLTPTLELSTGLKGALSSFTNDLQLANLENNLWVDDPRFTDVFRLQEQLGAIYSSLDFKPHRKLSFKAGVRLEYYNSDLISNTEGDILLQNYLRAFPSAYLSYQVSKNQRFQISYTERITRPSIRNIAPAFMVWGYNTILGGNPDIRPTISRRVNTSYQWGSFLLQLQFTDDDNALTYQPEVFAEDNLMLTRSANMPDLKTAMIGINFPVTITKWWESRYSISAYWQRLQPQVEGRPIVYTNAYVRGNITQTFKLPQQWAIELSAQANSSQRIGVGSLPEQASFNLGLKKTFSSRFSMALSWTDMFNLGSFYRFSIHEPSANMVYDWNYDIEGNLFRINLTYNLGNLKLRKTKSRRTGSEEERRRTQ